MTHVNTRAAVQTCKHTAFTIRKWHPLCAGRKDLNIDYGCWHTLTEASKGAQRVPQLLSLYNI